MLDLVFKKFDVAYKDFPLRGCRILDARNNLSGDKIIFDYLPFGICAEGFLGEGEEGLEKLLFSIV